MTFFSLPYRVMASTSQGYTGMVTCHQKLPLLLAHFSLVVQIPGILDSVLFTSFQVCFRSVWLLQYYLVIMVNYLSGSVAGASEW